MKIPSVNQLKTMPDEEVAALNRELAVKLVCYFVATSAIKIGTYYVLRRWAESMVKNANQH